MTRPRTKILVDGGDPQETLRVQELLGSVDGQTTNPSLVANNPHIKQLLASGHKLSEQEELDECFVEPKSSGDFSKALGWARILAI